VVTDVLVSESKVIALCVAAFAFGVGLFALGLVVDPVRCVRQRSLRLR
jgi:hypothetical protein